MTSAVPDLAFAPTKRVKPDWTQVGIVTSMALGVAIAGAGALLLAGRIDGLFGWPLPAWRGIDLIAAAFLVGTGPYAFHQMVRRNRLLARDKRLPDFLTDLASLHKAGLTLQDSLLTASQGSYGPLDGPIRKAADQVRWNIPILTALENLKREIGTPIAERTLTVVLEAGRTGGNVPEVLEIAGANCRTIVNLRDQRARSMGLYTIITYVASVIFIAVCLALQGIFVPRMIGAFSQVSGSSLGLKPLPTAEAFRSLFYTAALVQAVGNGMVGGIMSEGNVRAGLKHGWTMVALTFVGFLLS